MLTSNVGPRSDFSFLLIKSRNHNFAHKTEPSVGGEIGGLPIPRSHIELKQVAHLRIRAQNDTFNNAFRAYCQILGWIAYVEEVQNIRLIAMQSSSRLVSCQHVQNRVGASRSNASRTLHNLGRNVRLAEVAALCIVGFEVQESD